MVNSNTVCMCNPECTPLPIIDICLKTFIAPLVAGTFVALSMRARYIYHTYFNGHSEKRSYETNFDCKNRKCVCGCKHV